MNNNKAVIEERNWGVGQEGNEWKWELLIIVVWSRAVVVEMGERGDRLERDLRGKVKRA